MTTFQDKYLSKVINLVKDNTFIYIKNDMIISPYGSGGYLDVINLNKDFGVEGYILPNIIGEFGDNINVDNMTQPPEEYRHLLVRSFRINETKNTLNSVYTFNDQEYIQRIMDPNVYTETLSKIGPYRIFLSKFLFKKLNKGDDACINIYIDTEASMIIEIVINKVKEKIQIHRMMRCLKK
jgi:hypothetical protein